MADPNTAFFSLLLLLPLCLLLLLLYLIVRPRPIKIPIKKRHVFITGGSSGIGLALAHRFASEGARVSILARDQAKLDAAKQAISLSTGVDVAAFSADVRDFAAVKKAVEAAAAAEGGPIDILVCNQGVFTPQELEYQPLEEIKNMIDINLMGNFNLIKAALPLMKIDRQTRGPASIAIMSSQAGQVGIYGYTAYAASKFGLRGLAEALQQEVIADNIHVSLIFPPDTETPGLEEDSKYFLKMRSKLPLVPPSSLRAGTPSGKGTQRSYYPSEHPPKNELHAHFPLYTSRKRRGDLSDKLPGTSMSAQRANLVSHPFRWRPYLLLSHDAIERQSLMGTSKATYQPGKYFGNQSANAQTSLYLRPISLSLSPLPLLL